MRSVWRGLRAVWIWWPPGLCIAVLALLAAIFPLFSSAVLSRHEKAGWTAGFLALMVLEMAVIIKERKQQNSQYAADRERQNRTHLEQLSQIENMRSTSDAHNTAMMRLLLAANDPAAGLKRRALELSESILDFAFGRIQQRPHKPAMPFSLTIGQNFQEGWERIQKEQEVDAQIRNFDAETVRLFQARYMDRVRRLMDELTAQGYADENLARYVANIGAFGEDADARIRIIGERLGTLGETVLQQP